MARPHSARDDGLTHYEILAITPKHLEGQSASAQATVVKKAYHRALLRHHPDKTKAAVTSQEPNANANAKPSSPRPQSSSPSTATTTAYTVDQITEAYSVLSDSQRRGEYNRALFLQQKTASPASASASTPNGASKPSSSTTTTWSFRTGVETADLDDLGFDSRTGTYHRGCRCGNARGYRFEDADLEECEAEGVLMVGCADCSLWLRVLFAPAAGGDGDGDGEQEEKTVADHQQQQQNNREVASGGGGGARGETTTTNRAGFKVNWSFSLGISVGGSASASAGSRQ